MGSKLDISPEMMAKRWPAKFDGTCNICRKPYAQGDTVGIDPAKPTWYNDRAKKEQYNRAHADCIGAGARMLNGDPDPEPEQPPKRFSFDPRNQDKFTQFVQDLRALCEAYLG